MNKEIHSSNIITVDLDALRHNYRLLSSLLKPGGRLLAMVKGDGYGHGMVECAHAFAAAGCTIFGVAELCEGVRLRQAGIEGEIFVMVGFEPPQADHFITSDLTPVVFSADPLEALSAQGVIHGKEIGVHLKIDSGMGRLGVLPEDVLGISKRIEALPNVHLAGMLSHFPEADNPESSSTSEVFATYRKTCEELEKRYPGVKHIANSGAMLNFPETFCDMGRAGIALYGYSPDGDKEHGRVGGENLRPAMKFSTRIAMVKDVPAGTGISYGHTYTTTRKTRMAVMPVGYEDGLQRILSNRAEVLIAGRKVPLIGRICMNLCMADITGLDQVKEGDEAVFLGSQGDNTITADDIARQADTISYEILCLLGNNNHRLHVDTEV